MLHTTETHTGLPKKKKKVPLATKKRAISRYIQFNLDYARR